MSDLRMYEIEDFAWDEFGVSDDHIVPHPSSEQLDGRSAENNSLKRMQSEVFGVASNVNNKKFSQRKEDTGCLTLKGKRETMLDKGSWSNSSNGAFPASCDGDPNKMASSSVSDGSRALSHCFKSSHMESIGSELSADNPSLGGDQGAAVDNNAYHYSLNDMTPTENDLSLFNNDHHDKENGDLLYDGWPDIENFEDVDRMFRSCDSTFGIGIDNEDELSWFSSSHPLEGPSDALKSDFKFSGADSTVLSSMTECHEDPKRNSTGKLTDDQSKISTQSSWKTSSHRLDANDTHLPNNSEMISRVDDGRQITVHGDRKRRQKLSKEETKTHYSENGDFSVCVDSLKPMGDLRHPFEKSEYQSGVPLDDKLAHHSLHLNGQQGQISFATPNYSHESLRSSMTQFGNKTEDNGYLSTPQKESSYASNQMQSVESTEGCREFTFQIPVTPRDKKRGLPEHHAASGRLECRDSTVQTAFCGSAPNFEGETEDHSEVNGGKIGAQPELDSSNYQESSCMSSALDGVSPEASSFYQLQRVVGKLDIRTKLCIRDSLYRLARSAEQRHKCAKLTNGCSEEKDATGAFTSDGTNRSAGFMDMETDTNPIDRSIAHLLFHRPSDPSAASRPDAPIFKSKQ